MHWIKGLLLAMSLPLFPLAGSAADWDAPENRAAVALARPEALVLWDELPETQETEHLALQAVRQGQVPVGVPVSHEANVRLDLLAQALWLKSMGHPDTAVIAQLQQAFPQEAPPLVLYRRHLAEVEPLLYDLAFDVQAEKWADCHLHAERLLRLSQTRQIASLKAIALYYQGLAQNHLKGTGFAPWREAQILAHHIGMADLSLRIKGQLARYFEQPQWLVALSQSEQARENPHLQLDLEEMQLQIPSSRHSYVSYQDQYAAAKALAYEPMIHRRQYDLLIKRDRGSGFSYSSGDINPEAVAAEKLIQVFSAPRDAKRLMELHLFLSHYRYDSNARQRLADLGKALQEAEYLQDHEQALHILFQMSDIEKNPGLIQEHLHAIRRHVAALPFKQAVPFRKSLAQLEDRNQGALAAQEAQAQWEDGNSKQALAVLKQSLVSGLPPDSEQIIALYQQAPAEMLEFVVAEIRLFKQHPYSLKRLLLQVLQQQHEMPVTLLRELSEAAEEYSTAAFNLYLQQQPDAAAEFGLELLSQGKGLSIGSNIFEINAWMGPLEPNDPYVSEAGFTRYLKYFEPICHKRLQDPHPGVRYFCMNVLAGETSAALRTQIKALLKDPHEDIQANALYLMGQWKSEDLLDQVLAHPRWSQKLAFEEMLWEYGSSYGTRTRFDLLDALLPQAQARHVPRLNELLKQAEAASIGPLIALLARADSTWKKRFSEDLFKAIPASRKQVQSGDTLPLFKDPEKQAALEAAIAQQLAQIKSSLPESEWLRLLEHPNWQVQSTAKSELQALKSELYRQRLEEHLRQATEPSEQFVIYGQLMEVSSPEAQYAISQRFLNSPLERLQQLAWKDYIQVVLAHRPGDLESLFKQIEARPEYQHVLSEAFQEQSESPWLKDRQLWPVLKAYGWYSEAMSGSLRDISQLEVTLLSNFPSGDLAKVLSKLQQSARYGQAKPEVVRWFINNYVQQEESVRSIFLGILKNQLTLSDSLPDLTHDLQRNDALGHHAMQLLVSLGKPVPEARLLHWIQSPDSEARYAASVGLLRASSAVPPAMDWGRFLQPESESLDWQTSINLAAWQGGTEAESELRKWMQADDAPTRMKALIAWLYLHPESGQEALRKAAMSDSVSERHLALKLIAAHPRSPELRQTLASLAKTQEVLPCATQQMLNYSRENSQWVAHYQQLLIDKMLREKAGMAYPHHVWAQCSPYTLLASGKGQALAAEWHRRLLREKPVDIWDDYRAYNFLVALRDARPTLFLQFLPEYLNHANPVFRGQGLMALRDASAPQFSDQVQRMAKQDADTDVQWRAKLALAAKKQISASEFEALLSSSKPHEREIAWTGLALLETPEQFLARIPSQKEEQRPHLLNTLVRNTREKARAYDLLEETMKSLRSRRQDSWIYSLQDARSLPKLSESLKVYANSAPSIQLGIHDFKPEVLGQEFLPEVLNSLDMDNFFGHLQNAFWVLDLLLERGVKPADHIDKQLNAIGKQGLLWYEAERAYRERKMEQMNHFLDPLLAQSSLPPLLLHRAIDLKVRSQLNQLAEARQTQMNYLSRLTGSMHRGLIQHGLEDEDDNVQSTQELEQQIPEAMVAEYRLLQGETFDKAAYREYLKLFLTHRSLVLSNVD